MRASVLWTGGVCAAGLIAALVGACGDDSSGGGGSGGSGDGGDGGSGTTQTGTGVVVSSSSGMMDAGIGASCEDDSDCGGTLVCLRDSDDVVIFGGGPAGGYCSAPCNNDVDCPNGACLGDGADARCVESCVVGEPPLEFLDSPLDEAKCHGREDLRCQTVNNQDICVPTCYDDSQCGARSCDPLLAVCVDTPNTGLPNGDACDPDADPGDCAGICVSFTDGPTMCSNWCVLGGDQLSLSTECGGPTVGLCAFSPADNELGDYGFCTEACLEHDDCQNPTFWCAPINGITGNGVDNGFCFGTDDCPAGQADCMGADICTSTTNADAMSLKLL